MFSPFFVIPAVKKVYATKDDFEEKKLHYENLRNDAANAKSYADLLVNINDNKDLLENALIKKGAEVSFIEKLEGVAKEVGNEIEIEHRKTTPKKIKISPKDQSIEALAEAKKQEKAEASKVQLMVEVRGNYRTFLEFLYKITPKGIQMQHQYSCGICSKIFHKEAKAIRCQNQHLNIVIL